MDLQVEVVIEAGEAGEWRVFDIAKLQKAMNAGKGSRVPNIKQLGVSLARLGYVMRHIKVDVKKRRLWCRARDEKLTNDEFRVIFRCGTEASYQEEQKQTWDK